LIENGLAVGDELSHRKIKDGIVCLACGRTETSVHRFWTCPHSQSAWSCLSELSQRQLDAPPKLLRCHSDLKEWLLDWIGKASSEDVSLMFTMLYFLWQARNEARDSQILEDPRSVARRTTASVEEWKNVQQPKISALAKPFEHWLKPDQNWIKINTDGAFRVADATGGGGVVIRNHQGSFIAGANQFFPCLLDAEHAELQACRMGLHLAKDLQLANVILETDNIGVAAKLSRDDMDRSVHGPLVEEIKSLLRSFGVVSICAVRRSANVAAHLLAKDSCDKKTCNVWGSVAPVCVRNQLVLDSDMS